jgi:hypothetical protein
VQRIRSNLWNHAVQMGSGGLGLRLSTLSGARLWAQVWFGQPATLRVSRDRDSTGKSAKEPARGVVGGDGMALDALLSDQKIDELDACLASEVRPQECMATPHSTVSHRGGDRPRSCAPEPMAASRPGCGKSNSVVESAEQAH